MAKSFNTFLILAAWAITQGSCTKQHMKCLKWNDSTHSTCVSWAVSGYIKLSQEGILAISEECDRACGELGQKCEADVVDDEMLHYSCRPLDWERKGPRLSDDRREL